MLTTPHKEELYQAAHEITEHFMGKAFDTCSIINAKSGNCPEDCKWCAQRRSLFDLRRALLCRQPQRLCSAGQLQSQAGHRALLARGEWRRQTDREIDMMSISYRAIKRAHPELKCCASLGLLTEPQLKKLFDSGVTTYHCNVETSPSYFRELCTTHTQEDKEATLEPLAV